MTAITALTEDFTGSGAGAAVSSANTIFDKVSGQGASTIIADPYLGGTARMMRVVNTASFRIHERYFPATELLWFTFDLAIEQTVDSNTAIVHGYATSSGTAAEKIFDLRILANATTLNLRNISTAVWTSTPLELDTKYRVAVMVKLGASNRRLRVMILNGDGSSVLQDSGEQTATAAFSTISTLWLGGISSSTSSLLFGRLRGDDADGPATAPAASVGLTTSDTAPEPGEMVTLTATTTGTGTLAWTQTAGPTVTLSGSGTQRTFTAPAHWPSGSAPSRPVLTFQASYGGATQTVTVTPHVHTRWRKTASGWQPVHTSRNT